MSAELYCIFFKPENAALKLRYFPLSAEMSVSLVIFGLTGLEADLLLLD